MIYIKCPIDLASMHHDTYRLLPEFWEWVEAEPYISVSIRVFHFNRRDGVPFVLQIDGLSSDEETLWLLKWDEDKPDPLLAADVTLLERPYDQYTFTLWTAT